ncbi:MAG TPA: ATP-binding protein, partial [Caldimonas sp.]|nr:ATP-binding protein [Caldimonas sp.]
YMVVNHHFERRFGLRREDVIGRTDREVFPLQAATVYEAHDRQVMRTGVAMEVEEPATGLEEDGSWLSVKFTLLDPEGKPYALGGISTDITDRKRAEAAAREARDEAERANEAKSEFLSRMSHELRTPLNAVLGFTQLLQIEARHSARTDQLAKLGHIRAAGDHLLALINDVLDLSGLDSGELRLPLQPVALDALVRQSVPLVESLAAQHGVSVELGELGGVVAANPTRLRQVLINLLSNAIKYNQRGGRVFVHAETDGDRSILSVRDTGRGMSRAQLDRLFEPFNRFGVENEGIEGTGIGLTIVKAIIEGMGGVISVASQPGKGTAFDVSLPAMRDDCAAVAESAPEAAADIVAPMPGPRPGRILYIEDNEVNVMLVEELVRSVGGLTIVSELCGADGVARAREMRPDLVLIDLQLPDFDGFEVLRRLRADPVTRDIDCVALSANAMPEDIARGRAAGFADYWVKPIDFTTFLAALNARFPTSAERPAARSSCDAPAAARSMT